MKKRTSSYAAITAEEAEADLDAILERALAEDLDQPAIADAVRQLGPRRAAAVAAAAILGMVRESAAAAASAAIATDATQRLADGLTGLTAAGTPRRRRADLMQLTPSTRAAFLESQQRMARAS